MMLTNRQTFIPRGFSGGALALCIGAMVYYHLPLEPATELLYGASGLMLILMLLAYVKKYDHAILFIILGLLIGASYAQYRANSLAENLSRFQESEQTIRLQGIVHDVEYAGDEKWRVTLSSVELDGQAVHGLVRIRTREPIEHGSKIRQLVRLYPPSSAVIPEGFDFARYAFFHRIIAVGYALFPADIVSINKEDKSFWAGVRQHLDSLLQEDFNKDTAAVLRALILGDRQSLSEEQSESFRRSGLAHLLAISGLHIGMITFVVFGFIRRLAALHPSLSLCYPIHRYAAGIAVVFAYFYIELTGGAVSMYRAFIMICFVMLAWIVERDAIRYRSIALAALVIFLARPSVVIEPGFLLSFSAVIVLIGYWQDRDWWMQHFKNLPRPIGFCIEVFITSSLISILTSALLWGHFQTLYPYGALANIIAIPWMGVLVMPLILLYICSCFIDLNMVLAIPLQISIEGIVVWANFIADLPNSYIALPPISPLLMLFLTGLGLSLMVMNISVLIRGAILAVILATLTGFLIFRTDTDIVLHRPTGNWAIVTEQGFMLPEGMKANDYLLDQWQKILHRPRIPWQNESSGAGLEWTCSVTSCLFSKNGQFLTVSYGECLEEAVHPLRYCAGDPYRNLPTVRIMLETSGIKSLSSQQNRPWSIQEKK